MHRRVKSQETNRNKRESVCSDPSFISKLSLLIITKFTFFVFNSALKHHWASCPFIKHINTEEPVSRERYMLKCHLVIPNGSSEIYTLKTWLKGWLVGNDNALNLKIHHIDVTWSSISSTLLLIETVCTWRHGSHIGVPKQWNGGHVGVPNQSSGSWTLFLCKHFLLFQ